MNTQEAASLATKEANPVIDGRKANVNLAYLGAKPRVIPSPAGKFEEKPIENGIFHRRKKSAFPIMISDIFTFFPP